MDKGLAPGGGHFSSPMYNIVIRPPLLTMFTDSAMSTFGGYCLQTGQFFRQELSAEEQSCFRGSSKHFTGFKDSSINVRGLASGYAGRGMDVGGGRVPSVGNGRRLHSATGRQRTQCGVCYARGVKSLAQAP